MGSRQDNFVGLPPSALAFLDTYRKKPEVCKHCNQPLPLPLEEIDHYDGMFGDKFPLHRFVLNDGRTADEFHQISPWSGGPVHHLGLRVSSGSGLTFTWTDDEIADNL